MNTFLRALRLPMLATAVTVFGFAASAQDISDSHLNAARDAIASIKATDEFDLILPQAAGTLRNELIRKDPNLQQQISDVVEKKTLELAGRRADLEREAALAYARVFSEEQLRAIADFYTSEAGKKLISDGPIVTREVVKAAEIWQTGVARDLAEGVAKELESISAATPAQNLNTPVITPPAAGEGQQNQ